MIKSKFPFLKPAALGLVGIGSIEVISRYIIPEWIRNYSSCYKEAMQNLRNNAEAVNMLGEPIKEGRISYSDKHENNANTNVTWYTVPVEGSKTSGKLRYWITYDKRFSFAYRLIRVELQFNDDPNKILLIYRYELQHN